MGVTGLWKLIEPAGRPVPLETLENKVLAVDISIWIHQVIKGFQDSRGGTVPNAHLLGLFNRLCKLLYYRVKPVFVFDGGVPNLKIQTIAKRNQLKNKYVSESERIQQQILNTLAKHKAVQHLLKGQIKNVSPKKASPEKAVSSKLDGDDDMFKLPPIVSQELVEDIVSESESEVDTSLENTSWTDLHTVDVESKEFKSLPLETQYDILQDLKESRKQSSWGRIHELPDQSDDFSSFQMKRLRKRRAVQMTLDEVEKEMGGHSLSITDLERILTDEGILAAEESSATKKIASHDSKKYLYIKDLKAAISEALKNKKDDEPSTSKLPRIEEISSEDEYEKQLRSKVDHDLQVLLSQKRKDSLVNADVENLRPKTKDSSQIDDNLGSEFDEDLQAAIKLSLQTDNSEVTDMLFESFNETLDESNIYEPESKNMALARAYMMENSDLTQEEIHRLIRETNKKKMARGSHKINIDHILKNLPASKPKEEVESHFIKQESVFYKETDLKINSEIKSTEESSESDNDFVEVSSIKENKPEMHENKNKSIITVSSDSDSDFVEVAAETNVQPIEIIIKKTENVQDDIFEDIFNEIDHKKNEKSEKSVFDLLLNMKPQNKVQLKVENELKDNELNDSITERIKLSLEVKVLTEELTPNSIIKPNDQNALDEVNANEVEISAEHEIVTIDEEKDLLTSEIPIHDIQLPCDKTEKTIIISNVPASDDSKTDNTKKLSDIECKNLINGSNVLNEDTKSLINDNENKKNELTNDPASFETPEKNEPALVVAPMSTKELETISDQLQKETNQLMLEKSKQDRMGNTISEQMTKDIQELLQLFGIPYIIAPMEAEAQCAFLNEIKLTDGTITDDSDIWLFGGKTVYKNFFDQKKHVMEFRSENIFNHFKLGREQLIQFALLVGSDYTTGIPNVGPVTALEILAAFPSEDDILSGLKNFKIWSEKGFPAAPGKTALISKLKKVNLFDGFPSIHVVRAYLDPTVETSKEPFRWGQPDLTVLREYTRTKFGWTTAKTDDILKPVIAKMNIKQTQKSIKDFFHIRDLKIGSVDKLSKRVQLAVDKLSGKVPDENNEEPKKETATKKPKRQKKQQDAPSQSVYTTQKPVIAKKSNTKSKESTIAKKLHAKEVIPQKEKDKVELLKNKMKAVEVFKKSQKKCSNVKNQKQHKQEPLADANLSESSDD